MLCDHAEAVQGKLFVNGGGIDICYTQPTPPHVVNFGVAIIVSVPYTATNQAHELTVRLVTSDGTAVSPYAPAGIDQPSPIEAKLPFNLGRPPMLQPGDYQHLPLGVSFLALPLSDLGGYCVEILIDGTEMRRLPFRVMATSPMLQTPSS